MTASNPAQLITVTTAQAAKAVATALEANRPLFLWGKPGIGKSDIIKAAGAALGYTVIDLRLSMLDAVDLRGLPTIDGDRTRWTRPEFFPTEGKYLIFLDELNRAEPQTMNAGLQLVHDRRIGEHRLPDECRVIAAGNYEADGGGIRKLHAALGNRFLHLNVVPDLAAWSTWAVQNGIDPLLVAYHRFKGGNSLHRFGPENRFDQAFPSPRSWHIVSDMLKANPDPDLELALYAGTVGHAEAVDFTSFVGLYRQLPNIDQCIIDPQNAPVPTNVGTLYAVSAALAHRMTDQNMSRVVQYLERLPTEYNVFAVKDATARDRTLTTTPEYITWTVKHQDVM